MTNEVFYVTNPRVKDLYCLPNIIESCGDNVIIFTSKKELAEGFLSKKPDLIICDRSTFLLTKDQINYVNSNCYNIHPLSYLIIEVIIQTFGLFMTIHQVE